MATFKEIGEYLDKLELEKKFNLIGGIVEDVLIPKVKKFIPTPPDDLQWAQCSPKVHYSCIRLTRYNVDSIKVWMLGEAGFEDVEVKYFGLDTEYGSVKWGEWIVQEPNGATVFYTEEDFDKCHLIE